MVMQTTTPRRPVMRYHGGKWRLAPWIIGHFTEHRTYVEPFGGAASVLLRKPRSYAEVYNDLDGEVVNLFRVLRDPVHAEALADAVRLTPFARQEFNAAFHEVPEDDFINRARVLLIRSHMGFGTAAMRAKANGLPQRTGFRSNTTRARTHPAMDWSGLPRVVADVSQRMSGVIIEQRPAIDVLQRYDAPDTLHYVDPPYVHATRCNSSRWNYRHELDDAGHRELADCLITLRGRVVLSGYASPLYDSLFAGWERHEKATHADGARDRTEVLWIKPAVAA